MPVPRIRGATTEDLPLLPDIERAAGEAFRGIGMGLVADDEPLPPQELLTYQRGGRAWVADVEGRHVAYLILDLVDGQAHIEQVSVHPVHARQGIGRKLIDEAEAWARRRALNALTLTTFADVPWNAPAYRRMGFETIPEVDLGPELARLRRREADAGLDTWPRIAMRRRW